jgi:GNAT superfamily N-acetyltransferase
MYTVPEFRRMGISSNILNRLVDTGKEMGITAFELHATEVGEHVYKKNGFLIHNEPTYRKFMLT